MDVRRIALSLPEVTGGDDALDFRVRNKGIAWSYRERVEGESSRVVRPDVLVVRVASDQEKHALVAADGTKFFTTAHYNGYPAVLVRLDAVDTAELAELLTDAWRIQAPKRLVLGFDAARRSGQHLPGA